MTREEKNTVRQMREQGQSYNRIAHIMGLSLNTVKTFCQRHVRSNIVEPSPPHPDGHCKQCGQPYIQREKTKKRLFCSDACRLTWWKLHPDQMRRKAFYNLTCAHCGQPFQSYGDCERQYCGRPCYAAARRKVVAS